VTTGRLWRRGAGRAWAARVAMAVAAGVAAVAVGGCSGDSSVVEPKGPAARTVTDLWWPMLVTATAVFVFVAGMLLLAAARGRRRTEDQAKITPRWGEPFIVVAGVVVSGVILVGFFLFSLVKVQALSDAGRRPKLTVSVVGHDWWWEVRYPNGAVSANEIHIPTGARVRLALDTDDVIHSFWVPRLGPKIDMVPGLHNTLWLEAAQPGVYRGQCAEFCGLQHANMIIRVVADTPADFEAWIAREAEPAAAEARGSPGRQVFDSQTCAGCHTVRGTAALGKAGPDLTHFGRRDTLGAGVRPRTDDDLSRWITDPQSIKPGVTMPPTTLSPDQLRALLAYLEGLR
jgi:cytochrome c oxidase subunit 2